MLSLEPTARSVKDQIIRTIRIRGGDHDVDSKIEPILTDFLRKHFKSNSISRMRAIVEYLENKHFTHMDYNKMLKTAWKATRKKWAKK